MKKLMMIVLGLSLLAGTASVAFGARRGGSTGQSGDTGTGKKGIKKGAKKSKKSAKRVSRNATLDGPAESLPLQPPGLFGIAFLTPVTTRFII
ncbi:MAG TPA: hypothetical protein VKU01_35815 [Bryobacteraceae bacterium]|nr:hypothetical protein [Bryobacteraceae bacterium]